MPAAQEKYVRYELRYGRRNECFGVYVAAREVLSKLPNLNPSNGYRIIARVFVGGRETSTRQAWPAA